MVMCVVFLSCDLFFFSSRRRHTRCALVTGVQTCALPISIRQGEPKPAWKGRTTMGTATAVPADQRAPELGVLEAMQHATDELLHRHETNVGDRKSVV